ncbi:hypothetical protein L4C36_11215 [Photobacterium japonica]|uniref:hypothetical protein n=1 Tax=Photobacterium japonica TaxID=2910235 RepID=UPI003D124777
MENAAENVEPEYSSLIIPPISPPKNAVPAAIEKPLLSIADAFTIVGQNKTASTIGE